MKMLMCELCANKIDGYNMLTGPKGKHFNIIFEMSVVRLWTDQQQKLSSLLTKFGFSYSNWKKMVLSSGSFQFHKCYTNCIKCYSLWVWMRTQVHISFYWMGIKIFNIKINENVILRWASLSSLVIIWNYWHIYTIFDLVGFVVCICCALTHMVCVILCWDGFLICF